MAKLPLPTPKTQSKTSSKLIVFLGVAVVLVVSAFPLSRAIKHAVDRVTTSRTAARVDKHAQTAAVVMSRSNLERPTSEAAYGVVGGDAGTGIQALRATGTTYNGEVVLKIYDAGNGEGAFGTDNPIEHCYSYSFRHTAVALSPTRLANCPSGPALTLSPAPTVNFPENPQALLQSVLDNLSSSQRADAGMIKSAVAASFPAPITVDVTGSTAKGYYISLHADATKCMSGVVPPAGNPTASRIATGADCMGG